MRKLSYSELKNWKDEIPGTFPEVGRLHKDVQMGEYFWDWEGNNIHIDHYTNENAPAKIILMHSFGGNGRLLSFIGVPLWRAGFEILCPDLPPFGLSVTIDNNPIIYPEWITMINGLVEHEKTIDDKPIFLLGHGISGMLSYQVASVNKNISGIIVTSLLDQRELKVRMGEAINKMVGAIDLPTLRVLSRFETDLYFPLKELINIKKTASNKEICHLLSEDIYSWKNELNINFIVSFLMTEPPLEPEYFEHCPVLFAFPENDLWTPLELSQIFFDRLACPKRLVLLKKAGHLPIEDPGYTDLITNTGKFIKEIIMVEAE